MPNVSKKGKRPSEWARRTKAGERLVQLWLSEGRYAQLEAAAQSVEEPVTAWVRRAIFAALRKWQFPELDKEVARKIEEMPRKLQYCAKCHMDPALCGKEEHREFWMDV